MTLVAPKAKQCQAFKIDTLAINPLTIQHVTLCEKLRFLTTSQFLSLCKTRNFGYQYPFFLILKWHWTMLLLLRLVERTRNLAHVGTREKNWGSVWKTQAFDHCPQANFLLRIKLETLAIKTPFLNSEKKFDNVVKISRKGKNCSMSAWEKKTEVFSVKNSGFWPLPTSQFPSVHKTRNFGY